MCVDIEVSSSLQNTAWIRKRRGATPWARQSAEFAPEVEGTDTVLISGGTTVAHVQREDADPGIGRPIAFHHGITPPPPCDRLRPCQPDSARPGIGVPIAFQSPSVQVKFTVVKDIGVWMSVIQKATKRLPKFDPNVTAKQWFCWYDESTPAFFSSYSLIVQDPLRTPSSSKI